MPDKFQGCISILLEQAPVKDILFFFGNIERSPKNSIPIDDLVKEAHLVLPRVAPASLKYLAITALKENLIRREGDFYVLLADGREISRIVRENHPHIREPKRPQNF